MVVERLHDVRHARHFAASSGSSRAAAAVVSILAARNAKATEKYASNHAAWH